MVFKNIGKVSELTTMNIVPHAFYKMDPVTKALYRRYKDFKRTVAAGFPRNQHFFIYYFWLSDCKTVINSVFIKRRKESNVTSDTGVLRF